MRQSKFDNIFAYFDDKDQTPRIHIATHILLQPFITKTHIFQRSQMINIILVVL